MTDDTPSVEIFTDGSCLRNPGPGGFGILWRQNGQETTFSRGYARTTNNRMELRAVIHGLAALPAPSRVRLTTDSQYVQRGITAWLPQWRRRRWRTAAGGAVKNRDLWEELDRVAQRHEITWQWVKGHAGHRENECCDRLARAAATAPDFPGEDF